MNPDEVDLAFIEDVSPEVESKLGESERLILAVLRRWKARADGS